MSKKSRMNLIAVFDHEERHLLMCYRSKDPYQGLYNLVGGKIEERKLSEMILS